MEKVPDEQKSSFPLWNYLILHVNQTVYRSIDRLVSNYGQNSQGDLLQYPFVGRALTMSAHRIHVL